MLLIIVGMVISIILICVLSNSSQLLLLPLTTPDQFLENMPHKTITLFNQELIFIQPSSSFFVYFLGFFLMLIGLYFLLTKGINKSRWLWGIGLILWGLSAIVAGTSYQAFGYEIKCAGREYCLYTSNFELVYMLITAYSINYLVAATAFTSLGQIGRKRLIRFAVLDSILYSIYLFVGAIVPIKFLISYEGFMAFVGVNFIIMFILNIRHSLKFKDTLNKKLIAIWVGFLIVNISYFVFLFGGFAKQLYQSHGIWFNENDVLHILLILWAIMIFVLIRKKLVDTPI